MKNIIAEEVSFVSPLIVNKTYYPISISEDGVSFLVNNSGTAAAPCRLSFSPINDIMNLTITGLSEEPINMVNLLRNTVISIDGINNTIQIDGTDAFDHFNGWEFPKLKPGRNNISITTANQMSFIEIEFQPRYI